MQTETTKGGYTVIAINPATGHTVPLANASQDDPSFARHVALCCSRAGNDASVVCAETGAEIYTVRAGWQL